MKPVLISGIQPSGKLHIGNYLGALKNFVELQNSGKYLCYFFIADLHSLTEHYSTETKGKQILEVAECYLAAGLDPLQSVIFQQSEISAHSELAWILSTLTPMGELRRMTQFKEKSGAESETANAGLFTYPILMAADILLYDAAFVPVGDDQDQHLELARTLARKFNARYGNTFIEPKGLHTPMPRVMSLDDPEKKMSKSRPAGCLFLDDSPAAIRRKVMSATTDSGRDVRVDPEGKPGITNLIRLYSALSEKPLRAVEKHFQGKGYGDFKKDLSLAVIRALAPFQAAKGGMANNKAAAKRALSGGVQQARPQSEKKLTEIKKKLGVLL
jgi:tryptophanyl-tRNA synthetase